MKTHTPIRRPVLATHARYRWDAVRSQHQIVYPEAALTLNETGAAIVKRCDGRSIEEIVLELEQVSGSSDLAGEVVEFLQGLTEQGLLRDAATT